MPLNQELVNTALYGRILSYLYISHRSNQSHDEQQPKHGPRVQTPQDAFDTHAAASRSEVNTSSGGAPVRAVPACIMFIFVLVPKRTGIVITKHTHTTHYTLHTFTYI